MSLNPAINHALTMSTFTPHQISLLPPDLCLQNLSPRPDSRAFPLGCTRTPNLTCTKWNPLFSSLRTLLPWSPIPEGGTFGHSVPRRSPRHLCPLRPPPCHRGHPSLLLPDSWSAFPSPFPSLTHSRLASPLACFT